MLLGPIFSVELVTTSRRTRYFVIRVIYASIMLLVLWAICGQEFMYGRTSSIQAVAARASAFFLTFAWIQLFVVLLLGPSLAAGTIAIERERRTIEYLFATDLSNGEVVLGKLAARLLSLMYLVLVGLPILAIFRLLGGIPNSLLLVLFIITTSTMVTVTAVSICISVWSPRARDAVMRTYLILLAALLLPMLFYLWSMLAGGTAILQLFEPACELLLSINPLWVFASLTQGTVVAGASIDWGIIREMVVGQMVLSAACVLIATLAVRRVHLRAAGRPAGEKNRRFRLPSWRPPLGNHAMLWKELFARHAATRLGWAGNIALALLATAVIAMSLTLFVISFDQNAWNRRGSQYVQYSGVMGSTVGCVILLLIAARAAAAVTGERDRDCWTSLLSTPLSAREIVLSKVVGNLYAMRWLFALLLFIWALNLPLTPGYLGALPFAIGTFAITALFASALGVMYSLASKTTLRAMGATLATAVFVGGGYLLVCCLPILVGAQGTPEEFLLAPCIPFLLAYHSVYYYSIFLRPQPSWSLNDSFNNMTTAYLMGMIGYVVVSLALVAAAISNFDRHTGRTLAAPDGDGGKRPRPPRRADLDMIIPEVVDDN